MHSAFGVHTSCSAHGGLHAETHCPRTHTNPARHCGKQTSPAGGGSAVGGGALSGAAGCDACAKQRACAADSTTQIAITRPKLVRVKRTDDHAVREWGQVHHDMRA
jgi:hypothetical protein